MKLYDLLTPHEAMRVRSQTEVRNVSLNELTVHELSEIWPCIGSGLSESEKKLSDSNAGFMSVKALRVLKIRDFANVAHPRQAPESVINLFEDKRP